jgi:hypothetical protein
MGKCTDPQEKKGYEGIGMEGDAVSEGKTALGPLDTMFHKYVAIQRRFLGKEELTTLIDRMVRDLKSIARKCDSADKGGDNAH